MNMKLRQWIKSLVDINFFQELSFLGGHTNFDFPYCVSDASRSLFAVWNIILAPDQLYFVDEEFWVFQNYIYGPETLYHECYWI